MKLFTTLVFLPLLLTACSHNDAAHVKTIVPVKQAAAMSPAEDIPRGQLPENWEPKHYELDITIDPDDKHFSGVVRITAQINHPLDSYYLHGDALQVKHVELKNQQGQIIPGNYQQVDSSGVARVRFAQTIKPGTVVLTFAYQAPFNESLEGLYQVRDGGLNYAFTQFQAIAARSVFPGFDEPRFKVPFDISLTVHNHHVAISNTPEKSVTYLTGERHGMKRVEFETSKPLPTYLVAFAVGEFDVVEWQDLPTTAVRATRIPLRGIATRGKGDQLAYALKHTQPILESLEAYFDTPYPYQKLDILAVPDFQAGAMENAGAITYREQLLLLDEHSPLRQRRSYMAIHAHELAHQWFGNLVTPHWWDDIWLNEAFATWLSYTVLHPVYPEQKFKHNILSRSLRAMSNDKLISARQIRQPIMSNHDISSAFDGITYSKGAGVLEMMNAYVSPEKFRMGIQLFMQRHAFKTATADDFIQAISEKAGAARSAVIAEMFNSFLEQPGIPYLTINHSCQQGSNQISIKQSRYLPLGSAGSSSSAWRLPSCLHYAINAQKHSHCVMLEAHNERQEFTLPGNGCASHVMPNANGSGYYRYALNQAGWSQLYDHLDQLPTLDVMSLNDSFLASLEAGQIDFSALVALAPKLISSDATDIATAPMNPISFMRKHVAKNTLEKQKISDLASRLYLDKMLELGYVTQADDGVDRTKLRRAVINFMVATGQHPPSRQRMIEMAKAYTGFDTDRQIHEESADPNLIAIALVVASRDLGEAFAEHLEKLFNDASDGTVRQRLLQALASNRNPAFGQKIRAWILSDRLRDNEIFTIIYRHMSEEKFSADMWLWVQHHIDALLKRMPQSSQGNVVYVGYSFCSEKKKQQFTDFFQPRIDSLGGGPRALAQVSERIDLCIARVNHEQPKLKTYLEGL